MPRDILTADRNKLQSPAGNDEVYLFFLTVTPVGWSDAIRLVSENGGISTHNGQAINYKLGLENWVPNSTMVGAVAGTPGTLPDRWALPGGDDPGITRTIVGVGTENVAGYGDVDYIEVRYHGTTINATGYYNLSLNLTSGDGAPIVHGENWTASAFISKVAAPNPPPFVTIDLDQYDSGGGYVDTQIYADFLSNLTSSLQRFSSTAPITVGATNRMTLSINGWASGVPIDITLRWGWPQFEHGIVASTPAETSSGAVSSKETWLALPFKLVLLSDTDRPPQAAFQCQNIDKKIGNAMLSIEESPRIKIEVYKLSDFNLTTDGDNARNPIGVPSPLWGPADYLRLREISGDAIMVSATITSFDLSDEPCPPVRATHERLPALFYE